MDAFKIPDPRDGAPTSPGGYRAMRAEEVMEIGSSEAIGTKGLFPLTDLPVELRLKVKCCQELPVDLV